jgi:hypothetical protein
LPNQRPDAADFSARVFTPALEMSEHIRNMFSSTNNVGHKIAGTANFFIRGSNSRSGLKSIPAAVLIFDEYDEMEQKNINLAQARSDGQLYKTDWKVSTPTLPGHGIHAKYMESTQEHFVFPCPSCSKHIQLRFPESLVITADDYLDPNIKNSYLICTECKATLPHQEKKIFLNKGIWVPDCPGQLSRGFHVNQLYSMTIKPYELAQFYLRGRRDITAEQEFFNSKLGLPHLTEGAKITQEMFEPLIKGYGMMDGCKPGLLVTMGCDVGKLLHVEINAWDLTEADPIDINARAKCRVLWAGELKTFAELGKKMIDYNVNFAVVDAQPETRESEKFCNEFPGRARMCRYNSNATARSVFADDNGVQLSVNRTAWLDQSLGRFRNGSILLPNNLPRDYFKHLMAPARKPEKDTQGNPVYKYVTRDTDEDHYAHARNYSEIALVFATGAKVYKPMRTKV